MGQDPKSAPSNMPAPVMLTDRQFAELLGQRGGLTDEQVTRIVEALQQQQGLVGSLHRLSKSQQEASDAINKVGQAMGIKEFVRLPPQVPRLGNVVIVQMPSATQTIRIFYSGGVKEMTAPRDSGSALPKSLVLLLPACIGAKDRIGRIEFLGCGEEVLEFTGGERTPDKGERAQLEAVAVPQKRSE